MTKRGETGVIFKDKKRRLNIDKEDVKRREKMKTAAEQLEEMIQEFRFVCLNAELFLS